MAEIESKADRLARLRAEADAAEAEAEAAVSPDDAAEHAEIERAAAARRRKDEALAGARRALLTRQTDAARKAAADAYVVEGFDANETAPGAGLFVVRSVAPKTWQAFQKAVATAGEDSAAVDRAYVNLAADCILWTDAPDGEAWAAHRAKYPALAQSIGDMCGRLGGVAALARKR